MATFTQLSILAAACLAGIAIATASAVDMEWVRVSDNGKGFVLDDSSRPFVPSGFNRDRDHDDGALLEDYWDKQWDTIAPAFSKMKQLQANTLRIHLLLGKFRQSPPQPNQSTLDKLARLLRLTEETGIYLDLTGLVCYHKQDISAWYDKRDEQQRWETQAAFWEAIANTCSESPAVFCYDLIIEPVVSGGANKRDDWLGAGFGDKFFVHFIALETKDRARYDIACEWIGKLVAALRKHDQRHLITVGLVPWSLDRPSLTSGFVSDRIADKLDFIAMHICPKSGKLPDALRTVKGMAVVGKPVVIEEIFPFKCNAEELGKYIDDSRSHATGWTGEWLLLGAHALRKPFPMLESRLAGTVSGKYVANPGALNVPCREQNSGTTTSLPFKTDQQNRLRQSTFQSPLTCKRHHA